MRMFKHPMEKKKKAETRVNASLQWERIMTLILCTNERNVSLSGNEGGDGGGEHTAFE